MAINQGGALPLGAQVKADIVRKIRAGTYAVGAKIPSLKALVTEYEVAEATIHGAMRELQYEGVLEAVPGRGTFVKAAPEMAAGQDLATEVATLRLEVAELRERVSTLEEGGHSD
ncbi:MAG TPA: winged helix-turn-helix domain-containing protein [Pseudonocardia sp.]